MNDADLRFRASLSDDVTPQVDKIVQALKKAGASNAEIKMTLKAIDEATPKIKEAQRQLKQMPQQTVINVNANVKEAQQTVRRFRQETQQQPIEISFVEHATNNISRLAGKLRGVANTATLPLANALPMGIGYNLYYGLGAGILGGAGLGASALIKSTVGANSDREQSLVTLQQTLKDNTRATQELGKLTGIAQRTPFNYSDLLQADVRLRSYQIPALPSDVKSAHGKDPTRGQGWLKLAGDMSAAFGYPATQGVEAIADARQGYFRRLEDFGIRLQADDFAKGGKYSGLTFEQGLTRALKPFAGSQEVQAKTLKGIESNLHDVLQNQVLVPLGAVPTQALKQGAKNLYDKSNTDDFQRQIGSATQTASRSFITGLQETSKAKQYFDQNIKQPLIDATKAVVTFGQVVVKNFGGTVVTVVKTFADTIGLLSNTVRQIAGAGVTEFLTKWLSIFKALQFLGFRAADPILGLAKSINPLNFSLRGVLSNLLAIPGAIAKIGTVVLIKNFIEAKQAAAALHNQFKDLSDNKFDKLNADILLMAHGLDQSGESMQRLVTAAAGGIPGGVKDRQNIALEIAKQAAGAGRDGLDPKAVVQGILEEMKRTHDYSTDAARRFAQDVDVAGVSAKEFGLSLQDVQRTMREFAAVAGPVGLGGYRGAPALLGLQRGANAVPVTSEQISNGITSGDTLLMRMLQAYKSPSIDMLSSLGTRGIDQAYKFGNTHLLPASVQGSVASNFFDRNDTYNQNDRNGRRINAIVGRIAPDARIPTIPNPWNEQGMGVNFSKLRNISDPVERANAIFKEWKENTNILDSVQGQVQKLTNELNKQNATNLAYQQGLDNVGLQLQMFQHTLVPLQREIEDQTLSIQKYQLQAIHPLERQLNRLNQAAAEVSHTLQNSQYDMAKYSEGLLTGEQAVLDQMHSLELYNKQLQLLQLLNQQLGAQLGSTTYERGYSSYVKPMMGITLAMQMQKNERQQQKRQLEYDLSFGEQHYKLQQAQRSKFQRQEMSFGDRMEGIQKNVPIIDRATEAQHRMSNAQFELQRRMFHLNEHMQDQQDALAGLQIQLQEAATSPHFRHLQDEQYNLQIATTEASLALQTQQQTIDRWNATVTDLKSQGLDLGNVFHSMMKFDANDPVGNARKMVKMLESMPQSLGGISKDQGDQFMAQLSRMEAATEKARKKSIDTSQSWLEQLKRGFLGLFNEDTWNVIGAQVKRGLDPIIGSSLAGFLGGTVSIGGEATTIAISSGIIGNLIRLSAGRAFNNFLSKSGLFKGFYEGVSHTAQRAMVGVTEAGLPGGQFFARRAIAAQQMADGTRLGGSVTEALMSPFRVIRRFRQLLFGGTGAVLGGAAFGPLGGVVGGSIGRSVAEETTLRDTGRALRDTYVQAAKTAQTIEEKMTVAAEATKRVAKNVEDVVVPVAKAVGGAALHVPGVAPAVDILASTRGIKGIRSAVRSQILPLSVLKDIESGKITVEEAYTMMPKTAAQATAGPIPPGRGGVGGSGFADALDSLRTKVKNLGQSVDEAADATDRLGPAAKTAAETMETTAKPVAEAAKTVAPAAKAATSGLEEMLKFRKVAGPLGVIFDSVLASGTLGHGDIQNQGKGGLIGTGAGAVIGGLYKKSVAGALLGAGIGGLGGSALGSDDPLKAIFETAGAIAAQKYILEFGAKLIRGIRNLFITKVAPVMVEESVIASTAAAEAGVAAETGTVAGGSLLSRILRRGKGGAAGVAIAGGEAATAGGLLSKVGKFAKGGAVAGLALGFGGSLLGDVIGGDTGKQIGGAATGAGIGMLLGPEGAVVGGIIGLLLSQPEKVSNAKKALDHFKDSYKSFADTAMRTGDWKGLQMEADRARKIAEVNPDAADALNKTASALDKAAAAQKRVMMGWRVNTFMDSFGAALAGGQKVTHAFIKNMNKTLGHMSPDAQRHVMRMMTAMATKLYKEGKLPLDQYKLLISDFDKKGKKLKKDAARHVQDMVDAMTDVIKSALPSFAILGEGLFNLLNPKGKNHVDARTLLKGIGKMAELPHGVDATPAQNRHYADFVRHLQNSQARDFRQPSHTGPLHDPKRPQGPVSGGDPTAAPVDQDPNHKEIQRKEQSHQETLRKLLRDARDKNAKDDDDGKKDRTDKTKTYHDNIFNKTNDFGINIRKLRQDALDKQDDVEDKGFGKIHKTTKGWLGKIVKAVKGVDSSLGLTHGDAAGHAADTVSSVANAFAGGGLAKADIHKVGPGRLARLNEEGHDEMIIPLAPHRRNRAKSLINQAKGIMGFANGGVSPMENTGATRLLNPDGSPSALNSVLNLARGRVPLPHGPITMYRGETPPFNGSNPNTPDPAGFAFAKEHAIWLSSKWIPNFKDLASKGKIMHEVGHLYDAYNLNDASHRRITNILNKGLGTHYDANNWFSSKTHDTAGEKFADWYAEVGIGRPSAIHGYKPYEKLSRDLRKELYKHGFANGGLSKAAKEPSLTNIAFGPGNSLPSSMMRPVADGQSGFPTLVPMMKDLVRKYDLHVNAGWAPVGTHAGNSDHHWGGALDLSPRAGWTDPRGAKLIRQLVRNVGREGGHHEKYPFRWVGWDGDPDHGFGNHLHLSWLQDFALSGAELSPGQIRALLKGSGVGLSGITIPKIPKSLKGMGSVGARLFKALQRKKKIWNKKLQGSDGASHGGAYNGPLDHVFPSGVTISQAQAVQLAKRAGFPDRIAEVMGWVARAESTLQPGVVNPNGGATGLWQIYHHPDLVAKYGNMRNPWNNARAAHDLWKSGGLSPWDSSKGIWWAHVHGLLGAAAGNRGTRAPQYAGGIRNVPYDGMAAILHKGERVLTAGENNYYKSGPHVTGGHIQPPSQGAPFLYKGAEQRVLNALESLHDIKKDIKQMRSHLKDINDKTEKKKAEHHLQELNDKLRQQWASVRRDTRIADKAIKYRIRSKGDASDGEATNALVMGESSKFHAAIHKAVRTAKRSKPYKRAVHAATIAHHAVDRAIKHAHGKHSPGGRKVTRSEQKHIDALKHAARLADRVPKHILDQAKKRGRARYVTGAAHRGVNPDLIRQITGKGLDKGEKQLYNRLVKELQKGSKHAGKTAAALRKAIMSESSKAIKETSKHHKENVKHAQAAKKQRDQATKETRKVSSVAAVADKKRDKAENTADKREKDFYKKALDHLETIAHKDLNVTVHNTATGATLKSTVNNSRKKSK